jgi:hypothetical protein
MMTWMSWDPTARADIVAHELKISKKLSAMHGLL